jgi:2-hydroxychromene-2-carboxylate isomerase
VSSPPTFYFDLSNPLAYIAAELLPRSFAGAAEWQPVLGPELAGDAGESLDMSALERLASEHGLQPLRWPGDHPFDSHLAMRVATYAKSIGRVAPFAQAAFRQAFAGGRSLAVPDNVLIAAAACEMHPAAVLKGAELRSTRQQLAAATAHAAQLGITRLPAVLAGTHLITGINTIGEAVAP